MHGRFTGLPITTHRSQWNAPSMVRLSTPAHSSWNQSCALCKRRLSEHVAVNYFSRTFCNYFPSVSRNIRMTQKLIWKSPCSFRTQSWCDRPGKAHNTRSTPLRARAQRIWRSAATPQNWERAEKPKSNCVVVTKQEHLCANDKSLLVVVSHMTIDIWARMGSRSSNQGTRRVEGSGAAAHWTFR